MWTVPNWGDRHLNMAISAFSAIWRHLLFMPNEKWRIAIFITISATRWRDMALFLSDTIAGFFIFSCTAQGAPFSKILHKKSENGAPVLF